MDPGWGALPIVPRSGAGRKFIGRRSHVRARAAHRRSACPGTGIVAWHCALHARPKRTQAYRRGPHARALCPDHGRCSCGPDPSDLGKEFRGSYSGANCRQRNYSGGSLAADFHLFPWPASWHCCRAVPVGSHGRSAATGGRYRGQDDQTETGLSLLLGVLEASLWRFMRTAVISTSAANPAIWRSCQGMR